MGLVPPIGERVLIHFLTKTKKELGSELQVTSSSKLGTPGDEGNARNQQCVAFKLALELRIRTPGDLAIKLWELA